MQPAIDESVPAAGLGGFRHGQRIGHDAGNMMTGQQRRRFRREPTGVPRFADNRSRDYRTELCEKFGGQRILERQAGRQLHQQRPPLLTQTVNRRNEIGHVPRLDRQTRDMRPCLRHFYGETKARRHRFRPALICRPPMRAIE